MNASVPAWIETYLRNLVAHVHERAHEDRALAIGELRKVGAPQSVIDSLDDGDDALLREEERMAAWGGVYHYDNQDMD